MKKTTAITILFIFFFNYINAQFSEGWELVARGQGACVNNVQFKIITYGETVLTISDEGIEFEMPIIDDILLPNGIRVIDSTIMEFHARRTKKYTDTLIDGFYYVPGDFYWTTYTPEETKTGDCNDVADYFKYKGFGAIKISQDSLLVGGTVQGDMDYYCGDNLFDNTKFYLPIFQERIFKPGGELNIGINNKVNPFHLTITPNPVFSTATIHYTLGQAGRINIAVYDAMNNPVKSLLNTNQAAGTYTIQWDGRYTNGRQALTGLYTVLAIVDGKKYAYRVQVLK